MKSGRWEVIALISAEYRSAEKSNAEKWSLPQAVEDNVGGQLLYNLLPSQFYDGGVVKIQIGRVAVA